MKPQFPKKPGAAKPKGQARGRSRDRSRDSKASRSDASAGSGRSNSPAADLSHVTCYKCKKTGHYANKCPEARGAPGQSSNASVSSDGSNRIDKANTPCKFHEPWKNPPVICKKGDSCDWKHCTEPPKKGGPARSSGPGILKPAIGAAVLLSQATGSDSLQ